MTINYLGQELEVSLEEERLDFGRWREQILLIVNRANEEIMIRWSTRLLSAMPVPWLCLEDALRSVMWSRGWNIIRRIKKRIAIRRVAQYLTGDAKGASARSFRKAVQDAIDNHHNEEKE